MKNHKRRKILIVSHDAGGAEIVSAYVKKFGQRDDFQCLVTGPAKKIFKRKKIKNLLNIKEAIKLLNDSGFDLILAGTSWGSPIELEMIKEAKKRSIKSAAYLDHWVNYRERFGYPQKNWGKSLPDEIWVGDRHAYDLAKNFFKKLPIKIIKNLYFQEIRQRYKEINKQTKGSKNNILFMSEPIEGATVNSFGRKITLGFTEFEVLEALLKYFSDKKIKKEIVICYHPAEKKNKYDSLINRYKNIIKIRKQKDEVLKEMARASLVIGMMSMVLVVAVLCRKKTLSFLPDKKTKCPLPFSNIIKIRKASDLKQYNI